MREDDDIPEEERELFRAEMAGVRPLDTDLAAPRKPKPRPRARFRRADDASVMDEAFDLDPDEFDLETGEELIHAAPGVQKSVMRRLRAGRYRVDAALDLHGLTAEAARGLVRDFLADAGNDGLRCVRIIHGKGLRSGNRGPVIKRHLAAWLRRHSLVLAFASARPCDGGTGAVYVLLRRKP